MKIIVLRGKHGIGKTDVINMVYLLMIINHYMQVNGCFEDLCEDHKAEEWTARNDFRDILIKGCKKVGVVSSGDYNIEDEEGDKNAIAISTHLSYFEKNDCLIAICACSENKESEILDKYPNHIFVEKEEILKMELRRIHNAFIAESIFKIL